MLLLNKQTQAAQQDGGSEGLQLDELEKEFERIKVRRFLTNVCDREANLLECIRCTGGQGGGG